MSSVRITRRRFFGCLSYLGVGLGLAGSSGRMASPKPNAGVNRPLIVTSKTNPEVKEAITRVAWEVLGQGGSPLDAAEKATNIAELDPRDPTVGYGGDPNEEGFHQLDASVMSGPDG
ncbi:MAG: hypothetical protein FJY81_02675, partial [Candidatus Aminicenantes bacterium]|nr:hypothetical protein [Candidatus Aminicenantes bacterium]